MSEEEARVFIKVIFELYQNAKKTNTLYNEDDEIPQNIILAYYNYIRTTCFDDIIKEFKKKYMINEALLEDATKCERLGLGVMYDYIKEYDCSEHISIYALTDVHQLLFSKCPYPEFGGVYRKADVHTFFPEVIVPEHIQIVPLMREVGNTVDDLLIKATKQKQEGRFDIIEYVDEAVKIICDIIRIQPFADGNKRASRGFLNLLFKFVGLPPVYVENEEKEQYIAAMRKAMANNDYKDINKFYYYKICDSIYELDIKTHDRIEEKHEEKHK